MKLFKNINERMTSDELAQSISGSILAWQSRIAGYLNRKSKHLPGKTLLFILIGFCALFGSYCLYLLIGAIH
jgi:amino acid permease